MFLAYEMEWESWAKEVERFSIDSETILVEHSMGGGFWVRYLSEHPEITVNKVVLVAPWVNLNYEKDTDFFDFIVDPAIIERATEFMIFASDDDGPEVQSSVEFLIDKPPSVTVRNFHEYGHFNHRTLPDDRFPELLEVCLR